MCENLYNSCIDILFSNAEVTKEQIEKQIPSETMRNFFFVMIKEFKPNDIRYIFRNINPENNNLNLVFSDNAQNLVDTKEYEPLKFNIIFKQYIEFALNSDDFFHLQICYNTIRRIIIVSNSSRNFNDFQTIEKMSFIWDNIILLCFDCNYYINKYSENIQNLIKKESFQLFNEYIWSKNRLHLKFLTKNNVNCLMNKYFSDNTNNNINTQILILYFIFHHRNYHYELINIHKNPLDSDIFKEIFYSSFDLLDFFDDFFIKNKNINFLIENMFIVLVSQISKFYPEYNLMNEQLIYEIKKYVKESKLSFSSFYDYKFCIENINLLDTKFFYKNPYKSAIIFINILFKKKKFSDIDAINYYDIDKLFKQFIIFMEEIKTSNIGDNTKKVNCQIYLCSFFIKVLTVIYILFSSDSRIYGIIIEQDDNKLQKNQKKFYSKLLNILFQLDKFYSQFLSESKSKILSLMNEIILWNPDIFYFFLHNESLFNEELIKYLIENVGSSSLLTKYLNFLFKYDKTIEPELFLNGFILFGFWVNKYPLKEIYTKGLNVLFCIQKALDLRGLLKSDKNVEKFVLGIYLFFKAFPKSKEDTKEFISFLSKEIDYSFGNKTKEKIDSLVQFIKKDILTNNLYSNKNTLYVDINEYLENNFNKK